VTIQYLTGAHNAGVEGIAHDRNIGLLVQPGNRYDLQVHNYPVWAGDNGAFTTVKGGFSPERFRTMLARPNLLAAHEGRLVEYVAEVEGRLELETYAAPTVAAAHAFVAGCDAARVCHSPCLFVVAPDALIVGADGHVRGDAVATLERFDVWAPEIRAAGFPVALVAQNGLEQWLDYVWWDMVDVLFLGGGPDPALVTRANRKGEWKLSELARECVVRAQLEGKPTHMGRVNSYKRMALAQAWGVDTADGTFLAFGPKKNLPRLVKWLDKLNLTAPPALLPGVPANIHQNIQKAS
jgi:hypothetical protein